MMRVPTRFYETTPSGRIISRFSKDIQIVDLALPWILINIVFLVYEVKQIFTVSR